MGKKSPYAKISRPRLFDLVPRERLFSLLDKHLRRPLTWVFGPPGAGKTALVASYIECRQLPVIWYQVDAGDSDPAAVFHYLACTVEEIRVNDSAPLPQYLPEHLSDLPDFARHFFRGYFDKFPTGTIWVWDNYQDVSSNAPIHEILKQAILELPNGSSFIAVSRAEAPSNLIGLIAGGALTCIGWEQLQLSIEEVRQILAQRQITDDWLVRALHQHSQGWAAGITLMLERLGHFDGARHQLPSDTREAVFNYFANLILGQVPESTRTILLSVAFLPHVTPTLAQELSGCVEAPVVLEEFYRRRMFIDRSSENEPVYQFHALFLDFLRARNRKLLPQPDLAILLRRSAKALERKGELDAAMQLWIEANDWDSAIRMVLAEANGLLKGGRRETLARWISDFPASNRHDQPWLSYWLGLAHVQTEPTRGMEYLQLALGRFRDLRDPQGEVLCLAALLNAAFLGFVALESMDRWLDDLLGRMESGQANLSLDTEMRVWGVLCSALFWIRPWHTWTRQAASRVEDLLMREVDPTIALASSANALATASMSGEFECGDRILLKSEPLVSAPGASPSEAVWWLVHAGFMRFFEAQYEDALRFMHQACQLAERNGMRRTFVMCIFHRCAIEFRVSGWAVASATLAEMETMPRSRYPMAEAMLRLLQARRAVSEGRRDEAADLAELTHATTLKIGSIYQEMLFGLLEADILLNAGRTEKADPLISRSRMLIEKAPVFDCWRAALLFMESWLAFADGDQELALNRLKNSLSLAKGGKRKNYLRHFECAMPPLFRLALEEGIEVDLVQDIIRMFRLKPPKDAPDNWPWPVRIYTLGRFEARVNDEPIEFSRKLPRKTLLLLKAIVALGGREVPEQSLCDALWGDEEGDAARNALGITVLRLRKLLGSNESVSHQGGKISLNPEICWVDTWVFEERLSRAQSDTQKLLSLYAGSFLPEDEGESWSVAPRERLRGKFIDALSRLSVTLESAGDLSGAVQCYLRGIDADAIVESFYQGLMRCYEGLGRRTEALSVYRRLKHTLSVVLGVPPSEATQRLFRETLDRQAEEGRPSGSNDESSVGDGGKHSRREGDLGVVVKLETQRRRKR
jgi:LuxR family transcriptional regulator, maltose regulon positive regulatory protein